MILKNVWLYKADTAVVCFDENHEMIDALCGDTSSSWGDILQVANEETRFYSNPWAGQGEIFISDLTIEIDLNLLMANL